MFSFTGCSVAYTVTMPESGSEQERAIFWLKMEQMTRVEQHQHHLPFYIKYKESFAVMNVGEVQGLLKILGCTYYPFCPQRRRKQT